MKIEQKKLSERQLIVHNRLRDDLLYYCKNALKIKTKQGKLAPFVLNKAQRYIHDCLEKQLEEKGMIRAVILKGRQQGCSTYVGGRFYQKASWSGYTAVYILSHEADSTSVLFSKVKMYWELSPEVIRPDLKISNKTEFVFDNGSTYKVGTAGSGHTGRSQTNQLFHGSEVAFYEKAEDLKSGVLQTVSDEPGTEIILESTANGMTGFFYDTCMMALRGEGDYQLIFVPWFWQDEYRARVPDDFVLTDEERRLKALYDLDNGQILWRRRKIEILGERLFKQEYPFTVQEAFQSSGERFLKPEAVQKARKAKVTDTSAPVIVGVDPARMQDRTVIVARRGREILDIKIFPAKEELDTKEKAGYISYVIEKHQAQKCFIDYAAGDGIADELKHAGYGDIVTTVNFGSRADDADMYKNKRAEMAFRFKEWLEENGDVSIPDSEEVEVDLMAIPDFRLSTGGQKVLPSKDDIKKDLKRSTDIFDAIILTFAYLVANNGGHRKESLRTVNTSKGSALKTVRRRKQAGIAATSGNSYTDADFEDEGRSPNYHQYRRRR